MTDAAGFISLAQDRLRTSLGGSAEWQSWVGASGTGAAGIAEGRVYDESLPPTSSGAPYTLAELTEARPFAIISTASPTGLSAYGAPASFSDDGVLTLIFFDNVPSEIAIDDGEISRRFLNHVGKVMADVMALRDTAGYLAIDRIELEDWGRIPKKEAAVYGDSVQAVLRVEWSKPE